MRVEEYVNFSKTFTPYMRWELHFVEAFSPANEDLCAQPKNQAAATECLNTWFLAGMREQDKPRMEACFVKAGCASNWMEASNKEKEAFGNEYKSSAGRIGEAYQGYNEQFYSGLKVAWKQHEERKKVMGEVFADYFVEATGQLGCNEKCVSDAVSHKYRDFGEIMPKCGCGEGAWKIKTTRVKVLAATERVYGDLENVNVVDDIAIQSALIRLDM